MKPFKKRLWTLTAIFAAVVILAGCATMGSAKKSPQPTPAEVERQAEAERVETLRQAETERKAEAERQAETARRTEALQQAEAVRQAEATRQTEALQQAETERKAEAERQAETARRAETLRQVEAERRAKALRQAEAEQRRAEADRQAEAERQAEIERRVEALRQVEVERQAERRAEVAHQAEAMRRAEALRQAEAVRQAEATRVVAARRAEAERQAEATRQAEVARRSLIPPVQRAQTPSRLIAEAGVKSESQLTAFFLAHNPRENASRVRRMASYYIEEASNEGINSDVAFVQMCLETGFLNFGGVRGLVTADMHNYCGLGAVDGSQRGAGARFSTEQLGVRAHIQHLQAYALITPLNGVLVDPRYDLVKPHGKAPDIFGLTGTWASDKAYGQKLDALLEELAKY